MEKKYHRLFKLLPALIVCLFIVQACSDDPASVEEPDQPDIPQLEGATMDDSYFQENNPPAEEMDSPQYMPFMIAKQSVIAVSMGFEMALELPKLLLGASTIYDAEYDDGTWTWEFDQFISSEVSGEEEDLEVVIIITADVNENAGQIDWEFVITDSPFGTFTFLEMATNMDYSEGTVIMFDPETNIQVIELDWDVDSETSKTLSFSFIDTESQSQMSVDYSEDGSEFSVTVDGQGDEFPMEISWNTETMGGQFSNPESTSCWGEDLSAGPC